MAQDMLAKGKSPAEIAEIVFDSINENRFYILPHPAWDNILRNRFEKILARGEVAIFDPEEMMQRRADGEIF
ncbi:MAG: hypothetical protein AAF512_21070 [Pseudomonadota bacterium]